MDEKVKDLVCGMEIEKGQNCSTFKDKTYCFCSESCRDKFEKEPEKYIENSSGGSCCG